MLVLSRREGESIWIGDDIKVTILKKSGRNVSIGITAPKDIRVIREELELNDKQGDQKCLR